MHFWRALFQTDWITVTFHHKNIIFVFHIVNIGQSAFQSLAKTVQRVHKLLENNVDNHGRSTLLLSFVTYVFNAPFALSPATSNVDLYKGMSAAYVFVSRLGLLVTT